MSMLATIAPVTIAPAEPALRAYCAPGPMAATVADLVAAQAMRRPHAVALAQGSCVLSYDQLDCRANRLAHSLRSLGVSAGTPVGLSLPQWIERVTGALGILKAGGVCVPANSAGSLDRQTLVQVASLDPSRLSERDYPPKIHAMAGDLAFVFRALRAAGGPQPVEITHAGLSESISLRRRALAVTPADRVAQLGGDPDAALLDLWAYLTAGASVHLPGYGLECSPEFLRDWLLEQGITICRVSACLAGSLVLLEWPRETPLRVLLTGGGTFAHQAPAGLPFRFIEDEEPIGWMAGRNALTEA